MLNKSELSFKYVKGKKMDLVLIDARLSPTKLALKTPPASATLLLPNFQINCQTSIPSSQGPPNGASINYPAFS